MTVPAARGLVKPTLVYLHCETWWKLEYGATCLMEHDLPIYDDRPRKGRRRRVWICGDDEEGIVYLSRKEFLEHDEENCFARI